MRWRNRMAQRLDDLEAFKYKMHDNHVRLQESVLEFQRSADTKFVKAHVEYQAKREYNAGSDTWWWVVRGPKAEPTRYNEWRTEGRFIAKAGTIEELKKILKPRSSVCITTTETHC